MWYTGDLGRYKTTVSTEWTLRQHVGHIGPHARSIDLSLSCGTADSRFSGPFNLAAPRMGVVLGESHSPRVGYIPLVALRLSGTGTHRSANKRLISFTRKPQNYPFNCRCTVGCTICGTALAERHLKVRAVSMDFIRSRGVDGLHPAAAAWDRLSFRPLRGSAR